MRERRRVRQQQRPLHARKSYLHVVLPPTRQEARCTWFVLPPARRICCTWHVQAPTRRVKVKEGQTRRCTGRTRNKRTSTQSVAIQDPGTSRLVIHRLVPIRICRGEVATSGRRGQVATDTRRRVRAYRHEAACSQTRMDMSETDRSTMRQLHSQEPTRTQVHRNAKTEKKRTRTVRASRIAETIASQRTK